MVVLIDQCHEIPEGNALSFFSIVKGESRSRPGRLSTGSDR